MARKRRGPWMANFHFETEPLDEMEEVQGLFYGNRGQVGQQLVVTNRRILFGPIDVALATTILGYAADTAGVPGSALVKQVLDQYAPMQPLTIWLRHIAKVEPTNKASLFKPPGLRITTDTDQVIDFGIVETPTTMNVSPRNNIARDRAVETLLRAIQSAKEATPPT
jgi:hypothetical protein